MLSLFYVSYEILVSSYFFGTPDATECHEFYLKKGNASDETTPIAYGEKGNGSCVNIKLHTSERCHLKKRGSNMNIQTG